MTRFNISLEYATDIVIWSLSNLSGGELLVPKLSSYKILDLAKAINPKCKIKIVGIRPGEKIHEEMISTSDSQNTLELRKFYLILPKLNKKIFTKYKNKYGAKKVKKGFTYSSNTNSKFLSIIELRKLVKKFEHDF